MVVVNDVVDGVVVGNGTVPHGKEERGENSAASVWVGWRRKRQAREKEGWLILSACGACLPCNKYLLHPVLPACPASTCSEFAKKASEGTWWGGATTMLPPPCEATVAMDAMDAMMAIDGCGASMST